MTRFFIQLDVNRVTRIFMLCIYALLPLLVMSNVHSNDLNDTRIRLEIIADHADRICNKIPIEGSSNQLELSGLGKIEFTSFLKFLSDVSLELGAGKKYPIIKMSKEKI